MLEVFDRARPWYVSPWRRIRCCLPHHTTASAPRTRKFRGSILGLPIPLSTLRARSHDRPRMTRGQSGWLGLLCATLSFATPHRFIPAHRADFPHPAPRDTVLLRNSDGMDDPGSRQRIPDKEAVEPLPGHLRLLRPPIQPFAPFSRDLPMVVVQCPVVAHDSVVGVMPTQASRQLALLPSHGLMTPAAAPLPDSAQRPGDAARGCLALDHPGARGEGPGGGASLLIRVFPGFSLQGA
jgi:hypothetical protein